MLISPPFLPARANHSETDWLALAMNEGTGEGAYPVGNNCCWHGGIHLQAPSENGQVLPVRAIADGTIIVAQQPNPATRIDDPNHLLNYNGGWTNNGVVVIQHDTEIGADAQGAATTVRFFSVYQHLSSVSSTLQPGRRVYRKDELGRAGYISGQADRIHFEIACDADNLQRLIGRRTGNLPTTQDGRSDVVFGELYFTVPADSPFYAQKPLDNDPAAHIQPPRHTRHSPLPPIQPLAAAGTTSQPCIVGLRFAMGEGAAGTRGNLTITTYREDGSTVGTAPALHDYEYNLYTRATEISNAYPENARPAPSAVFELLRFGRVINTAHETLTPADVPLWHEIALPTASGTGAQRGWVNLNNRAPGQEVRKFSDADFPHWKGWRIFDDDLTATDSRCDSDGIKTLLDIDGDHHVTPTERVARMSDETVRTKMRAAICAMPSEWDTSTLQARWGWLQTQTEENPEPLDQTENGQHSLQRFLSAYQQYCFNGAALFNSVYRFHPKAFIQTFRQCGWLRLDEVCQLLPRRHGQNPNRMGLIPWNDARARFQEYATHLNKTFRKYLIIPASRQTHFLAQTFIETAMWSTMEEFGRGHQQRRRNGTLYWPAPAMEFYQAFYGRGIMQLTWAGNYEGYGIFRSFPNVGASHVYIENRINHTSSHYWADPRDRNGTIVGQPRRWADRYDPSRVSADPFNACDSGAYYWISKNTGGGHTNINRVADDGVTVTTVGRASVLVNGGGYGYVERQAYAKFIERYRGDSSGTSANETFQVTRGTHNLNVYVDFTPQRPR